jgi:hypothetical protein
VSSQTSQGSGSKPDDEAALRALYQQIMDSSFLQPLLPGPGSETNLA